MDSGWGETAYPVIVGHEIVGTVVEKGAKVSHLKVGDRVGVGAQVWACLDTAGCTYCKQNVQTLCPKRVFTYNDKYSDGSSAYGGYAEAIRCSAHFAFKIPDSIESAFAAPLLCAGINVYGPLKRHGAVAGTKCGIVGIGGLGHLALQFANVLGSEVYAISHSPSKREESLKLGAKHFINMSVKEERNSIANSLDMILLTANYDDMDLSDYLQMIKPRGKLIMVGVPNTNITVSGHQFIASERCIVGSLIGSIPEIKEMLQVAADHNVQPVIQKMPMEKVNEGIELVKSGKVRYRVVLSV